MRMSFAVLHRRPRPQTRHAPAVAWLVACLALLGALLVVTPRAEAVYNGKDADFTEFPWAVHVELGGGNYCSGTLVRERWVLMAAHCIYTLEDDGTRTRSDLSDVRVAFGTPSPQSGDYVSTRAVYVPLDADGKSLLVPEEGTPATWVGDVALIELDAPATGVPLVTLGSAEPAVGTAITGVGWGHTQPGYYIDNPMLPDRLQQLDDLFLLGDDQCLRRESQAVKDDTFCALVPSDDRGMRPGDSGGPGLRWTGSGWEQVGVLSNSVGGGNVGTWISVARYRDWITETVDGRLDVSTALIIDSSGSMVSNDPQQRRLDAASAYITAAPVDDEVAVIDFDSFAYIRSPATWVGWGRPDLLDAVDSVDASGGTNLGRGLQAGCEALEAARGAARAAIFLTDGDGSYSGQAECFADKGWKVYAIGLGDGVDEALLTQIAQETGGRYIDLDDAQVLVCEFQQIRAEIAGAIPQSCEPSGFIEQLQRITFPFLVPDLLQQITFTNIWGGSDIEMTVTSPSGVVYHRTAARSNLTTSVTPTSETFTITNPEPGAWDVELFGADIPEGGEAFSFSSVALTKNPTADTDGDGVLDATDQCPTVPGAAGNRGCPEERPQEADSDGDGVADSADRCPTTPGPVAAGGCPTEKLRTDTDADGDGVADSADRCPATPGPASNGGCPSIPPPTDTDTDGVTDSADRCPTAAGPASNGGCPLITSKQAVRLTLSATLHTAKGRRVVQVRGATRPGQGGRQLIIERRRGAGAVKLCTTRTTRRGAYSARCVLPARLAGVIRVRVRLPETSTTSAASTPFTRAKARVRR